jgi:hypothetical protein
VHEILSLKIDSLVVLSQVIQNQARNEHFPEHQVSNRAPWSAHSDEPH